jgi:hypothetical protein
MRKMPMKSKIFNTDQVRAIQEGRMTQSMQVVKRPLDDRGIRLCEPTGWEDWHGASIKCPFGKVGDVIAVRETWAITTNVNSMPNWPDRFNIPIEEGSCFIYRAHGEWQWVDDDGFSTEKSFWRSPATMPREAARLFLRITHIRVMRVQELTGRDILNQGYDNGKSNPTMGIRWENMQRMHMEQLMPDTWNANPYMWILDFTKTDNHESRQAVDLREI